VARYQGRHRTAPVAGSAPVPPPATPVPSRSGREAASLNATLSAASRARATAERRSARHAAPAERRPGRGVARPVLASALTLGLVGSGLAYAKANHLIGADPAAFVVGSGVAAQTDELARASTVDLTYRAAASVSRNERRTAIAASGARDAQELEAKQKVEAARKAKEARAAAEREERERARQRVIANAKEDPKSVARLLMVDHGWTSDAQYNCLVNLWIGESDWRWWAENSSSGAYGIPQSLPARKMAQFGSDYRTNPVTQIKWGLWYIEMSYGNPCNAWSTWQARSPHWY
jgi:hypothetical protein